MTKHWEAELEALKGNNAKLTAALLESTANVKQWKQQLAAYQEEAERLHKRVICHLFPAQAKNENLVKVFFFIISLSSCKRFVFLGDRTRVPEHPDPGDQISED